jgi:hypothetical protein
MTQTRDVSTDEASDLGRREHIENTCKGTGHTTTRRKTGKPWVPVESWVTIDVFCEVHVRDVPQVCLRSLNLY